MFFLFLLFFIIFFKFYIYEIYFNLLFIYNLFIIYKNYPDINDKIINDLTLSIDKLGIFAIKLVQWGLTRLKLYDSNIYDKFKILDKYYENCPTHSDKYTLDILKKDYKVNFSKYFDLRVIASGSIAQVYKITDKKSNKDYALKIIHPNLKKKLLISKIIINTTIFIYRFISSKNLIYLDLKDFFNHIELQINLNKEYEYHKFFYKNYTNKFIYVPKPILHTENTLIMEFITGTKFDDLDLSLYKKAKIIQNLKIFSLNCYFLQKYIHTDLHNGNWKIRLNKEKNNYEIILYDFGLCYDAKNFNLFKLREYLSEGNIDTMTDEVLDLLIDKCLVRNSTKYIN